MKTRPLIPVVFEPPMLPLIHCRVPVTLLARYGRALLCHEAQRNLYWNLRLLPHPTLRSDARAYINATEYLETRLRFANGCGTKRVADALDLFYDYVDRQHKGPSLALYGPFRLPVDVPVWRHAVKRRLPKEAFREPVPTP